MHPDGTDHDHIARLAVLEERLRGMDEALRVRTAEIARRLDDLNHSHDQALSVQKTYVSEEVHDRDVTALRATVSALAEAADKKAEVLATTLTEAREASDARFHRIESFQAKILGALGLATLVIPTFFYLLSKAGS